MVVIAWDRDVLNIRMTVLNAHISSLLFYFRFTRLRIPQKSFLHGDLRCAWERLGRRWRFIVANRQSRGFTPQVNEWLSTVISPNTDYQMFFKEQHWNTYEAILTGSCRICNAIMPLSNKTN